jgi:hypothetical protein
MKLVESVYEVAEEFMKNPTYVSIDYDRLNELVEEMKSQVPSKFPSIEEGDLFKSVIFELVGGAINYCYWYGRDDVRPGGASSTFMYENLQNAFFDYDPEKSISSFRQCIDNLIQNLTFSRFPLLEERIKHLYELVPFAEDYTNVILQNDKENLDPLLNELVGTFPGYASDIFLKRASLFFLQLHRKFGWFEEAMKTLHIPADYQVPKLMNHEGVISYNTELNFEIHDRRMIQKGSQKECEIRSATVLVARYLCNKTGWNIAEVDGFFWLRRKEAKNPFHLTITTDY